MQVELSRVLTNYVMFGFTGAIDELRRSAAITGRDIEDGPNDGFIDSFHRS
ncbi:MAG: hypothetical protein PHY29_10825 [Syntrophales bacterium]|nr:hypothetical protein [Syntrophales bacterium]